MTHYINDRHVLEELRRRDAAGHGGHHEAVVAGEKFRARHDHPDELGQQRPTRIRHADVLDPFGNFLGE